MAVRSSTITVFMVWFAACINIITATDCKGNDISTYDGPYARTFGENEAICQATYQHCRTYSFEDGYSYYAFVNIQGFQGPTSEVYSFYDEDANDALQLALDYFFHQYKNNITCNCVANENSTVNQCDITTKVCFSDVILFNGYQTGLNYETWITNSNGYTGYYCCDTSLDESKLMALQDLNKTDPLCFTSNPTHDPTMDPTTGPTTIPTSDPTTIPSITPTADPTVHPTLKDCANCILLTGQSCLGGYHRYEQNKHYCEPCPAGTAGKEGQCMQCKDGEEQTFDRTSCEETRKTQVSQIKWTILLAVIGGIFSFCVGTVICGQCIWPWCKKNWTLCKKNNQIQSVNVYDRL